MAEGGESPEYKAVQEHFDVLAAALDANSDAKKDLLRKFKAKGWFKPPAKPDSDEMIGVALDKIRADVKHYEEFIGMLKSLSELDHITIKITEEHKKLSTRTVSGGAVIGGCTHGHTIVKPNLALLNQHLKNLTWADVKLVAIDLGVEFSTLKRIKEENDVISERVLSAMDTWLNSDPEASWMKVVDALISIEKNVLAKELKEKYCTTHLP